MSKHKKCIYKHSHSKNVRYSSARPISTLSLLTMAITILHGKSQHIDNDSVCLCHLNDLKNNDENVNQIRRHDYKVEKGCSLFVVYDFIYYTPLHI